jgi:hypothetical protein
VSPTGALDALARMGFDGAEAMHGYVDVKRPFSRRSKSDFDLAY